MDALANSFNSSIMSTIINCSKSRTTSFIYISWLIVYILFLPVFLYVLYIGYQRWRKRHSASMAATHSDVFTFHMVIMEMINIVASCLYCWYLFTGTTSLGMVGTAITYMVSYGQTFFHVLTCMERYLAVSHPITYQDLKQVGGVRIRNLSIGCVWLLSFGLAITANVLGIYEQGPLIFDFFIMFLSAAFISFCSISVLCVLIRPGPGEVGGDRKLANKSKRRALNTMMTILAALLLKLICYVSMSIIFLLGKLTSDETCVIEMSFNWCNLPSSLVLPLLFLHRRGKLPGNKHK